MSKPKPESKRIVKENRASDVGLPAKKINGKPIFSNH
jgi:hypothetical protein